MEEWDRSTSALRFGGSKSGVWHRHNGGAVTETSLTVEEMDTWYWNEKWRFVLWAFVTRACSWSTGRGWHYALHVINLCANSIFTLLRFWHLLLPFTLMLRLIMNDNINGNEKIHPSTVAVISHSPVSWHQRTNNVQNHWHLNCITFLNALLL